MARILLLFWLALIPLTSGRIIMRMPILVGYDLSAPVDSSSSAQPWSCDFETTDCGIWSQYNMGQFVLRNRLTDPQSPPFFGRDGVLLLNASIVGRHAAARLETPYFPDEGTLDGCLTIEYMMYGPAVKSMYILKQDKDNSCLWFETNRLQQADGRWQRTSLSVSFYDGWPRFYFEAYVDHSQQPIGVMAISRVDFKYERCQRPDNKQCVSQSQAGGEFARNI